ncbi:DMT family transporter [Sedimenticola hydrogenitrophicus]|uniref:DMT family transporter n=1 Tax=Sedimenticola hydrogenitrophicus TaxID=2967975 RepID=UPI0023B1B387|nr:DMT family transporter [Sedimenticola hydrogenitrophicus]
MILSQGVHFALLSMLFAGINDVIFKKYAMKNRSRGMYVLGVGFTWAILQILYSSFSEILFSFDILTIKYGLLAGVILAVANISLIEGLTHIDVSLGSTVYRLNTVGVVILSFVFLSERIEPIKLVGITFGIISVLLLYKSNNGKKANHTAKIFFWLVVLASLFRAAYGVVSKVALLGSADKNTIILLASLCWVVGGAFYAKYVEKRFTVTPQKALYSAVSGVLVFCIVNFLILGLKVAQASIVVPIANMSFIIALLISVLIGTEKMNFKKIVAVAFAAGSIVLLSSV